MCKKLKQLYQKIKLPIAVLFGIFLIWYLFFSLPRPLFKEETSTLIYGEDFSLLGATISEDEQWRFPANDSVPKKFGICITQFEDAYFQKHPGVNPVSLFRAFRQNSGSSKIISGGSTITMQTIRLAKKNPKRSYFEKFVEILQATRLELTHSKEKILSYYVSHAPFGGNVVGLDAAAWRYYAKAPHQLSWSECATLAVLPNAPALIFPGKNQEMLVKKRNRLLKKLKEGNYISKDDYTLALLEPLPGKPNALPKIASHLLHTASKSHKGKRLHTTLQIQLQEQVNQIVEYHRQELSAREIHNIAVLVVEVETGNVKAYIGNTSDKFNSHSNQVDVIQAPRSSGSILKPFLYAPMIQEGKLLPKMLLSDTPHDITENYEKTFSGAVAADEALARSLNVPAVHMLEKYSVAKFHHRLQEFGFSTFVETPKHYGLSLIVGGGEVKLWELAQAYRNIAYRVSHTHNTFPQQIHYIKKEHLKEKTFSINSPSAYLTVKALQEVVRPDSEAGWELYSSKNIAWKTGTSHGFRDAWAVGMTADYVVAVWVGNADGEGRPGLVGVRAAAPVMFDVFNRLRLKNKFSKPKEGWMNVKTCKESGFLLSENCESYIIQQIPKTAENAAACPYHQRIHLDKNEEFRVNNDCYPVSEMVLKKWFVLPPIETYYYQKIHPNYKKLPSFKEGCNSSNSEKSLDFIYPKNFTKIYLPADFSGVSQSLIFEVAYTKLGLPLFWYLDGNYLGTTTNKHQMAIQTEGGIHKMTVSDTEGNEINKTFTIVQK